MRMGRVCVNWKVLVGLGIVGVAIWAVAPVLFLAALPILLLAACPLSMLLMMWSMKHDTQSGHHSSHSSQASLPTGHGYTRDERLAALKAQQAIFSCEIAELDQGSQRPTHEGEFVTRPKDEGSVGRP
jgi:uncharacterized membrane protein